MSITLAIESLPGITPVLKEALATLDLVRGHRVHRRHKGEFVSATWAASARALVDFTGCSSAAALSLIDAAAGVGIAREPQRALAALHVIATSEDSTMERGTPRPEVSPDRLIALNEILVAEGSSVVVAALLIAEVESMPLFATRNTEVALVGARALLIERGADPDGIASLERGIALLGSPSYRLALKRYEEGTEEALVSWLTYISKAIEVGAQSAFEIADTIQEGKSK